LYLPTAAARRTPSGGTSSSADQSADRDRIEPFLAKQLIEACEVLVDDELESHHLFLQQTIESLKDLT